MFAFGYGIWNSTSLLNGAIVLAEHGWQIDILTDVPLKPQDITPDHTNIEVHVIGAAAAPPMGGAESAVERRTWRKRLRAILPAPIERFLMALWVVGPRLIGFTIRARRITRSRDYSWFIGAETTGLAAAASIGAIDGVPAVYWSLELWLWREARTLYYRLLKLLEFIFHRNAAFTIIPSAAWIPLLGRENGVAESSFVVVPATARGPARTRQSSYLRDKLGIPAGRKIILYAGSLVPWALTSEVAKSARGWPEEWVLVLHGWGEREYVETLRANGPQGDRMRLSLNVVAHHELDELIASADVGIAIYDDDVMARRLITSASSKVGQYLKCGVPVVVNDFPWFRALFSRHRCGVAVARPDELASAISTIFAAHDTFRAEAVRCFDESYDFDAHFSAVLRRLRSSAASL